ncbi:MAG: efflux RND transporter periplasmic adaptor subunit, partial [Patescibacteria group bacterium]
MKLLKNKWFWVGLIVLVIGGGFLWNKQQKLKIENGQLKIVEVQRKNIVESITVSGKIAADKQVTLTFPATGKLSYVKVKPGDSVKSGQWMAALDTGDLQAAVTKAWYSYLAYDAAAKVAEDSVKGHEADETFAQKNTRVAAQTARDSAYESWLSANRAVQLAVLKAPFAGMVTAVTVSAAGDIVGVTDGITVVDPETLYFDTEVDETDFGKIKVGQRAIVKLDAFEDIEFDGVVTLMGYATKLSDSGATVIPVRIGFLDPSLSAQDDKLRLGLNGDAELILAEKNNVLTLPIEAVNDNQVELPDGKMVTIKIGLEGEEDI